jgi:hypothetical protein
MAFKRFHYMRKLLCPYLLELKTEDLGRMREYQAMMGNIQDVVCGPDLSDEAILAKHG